MGQESKEPIRIGPKKAGNWFFSTVTVAGFSEPLQIASLPGSSIKSKKKPPHLVIYCQRGSVRSLNAFVDWREEVSYLGKASVWVNGREAASFDAEPLVAGNLTQMKLPAATSPLLKRAIVIELSVAGEKASFLLLHWDAIQQRMLQRCAAN